jgi:rSAM/selenodomain-associated transferase 1
MFVKEPVSGFVKTRLAKTLGDEKTLALYEHFVNDLINTLKDTGYEFKLCVYPNNTLISKVFGNYNNFMQEDGDLGVKMQKAFESQFNQGYEKIILIGSDTPHIPKDYFEKTFKMLDLKESVIGPSLDGGYYLIAFNKKSFNPKMFQNIKWSSEVVLKQTLEKTVSYTVQLLYELNDIDTQEDLENFYIEYKNSSFKHSKTMKLLDKYFIANTNMKGI